MRKKTQSNDGFVTSNKYILSGVLALSYNQVCCQTLSIFFFLLTNKDLINTLTSKDTSLLVNCLTCLYSRAGPIGM